MNAERLAELLEQHHTAFNDSAASMLRRQHEAIRVLRAALENARIQYDYHGNPMEDCDRMVIAALADTESFAPRQHITDGSVCWCNPTLTYKDPDTGAEVWVHQEPQ